jgi:hypothetical protein
VALTIVVTANPVIQIVRGGIQCSIKEPTNIIVPEYMTSAV